MKNRIIISIKELNRSNWSLIYCFIKRFYENLLNNNHSIFNDLSKIATIKRTIENDKFLDRNVYSIDRYGIDLTLDNLPTYDSTSFSILYQKQDQSRDISNIVPFYFLHREFENKITLGINLNCFSNIDTQSDYTFPCRTFLGIFKNTKPIHGKNTVYFIDEKGVDRTTGEASDFRTPVATFRMQSDEKHISRYILPLTIISKELFYPLFKDVDYENEKVRDFSVAVDKQDETLKDNRLFPRGMENKKLQFRSVFEEWFIKAYFTSFKKPTAKIVRFDNTKDKPNYIDNNNFYGLINLLKSYCENIKELVENIIFHTDDKHGLIYIVFQKKESLTENQKNNLLNINSYSDFDRFVEIGIMDFNKKGIIDKYNATVTNQDNDNKNIKLTDFYDTTKIHTTGLDHLYLRYAAHLGIKTFANSVKNHNGSFYVESNNDGVKEAIKYYLGKLPNESEKLSYFFDGTHYEIIFPIKKENNYKQYDYNNYKSFIQYKSISNYLKDYLKKELPVFIDIDFNQILKNAESQLTTIDVSSKDEQNNLIKTIGDFFIQNCLADDKNTIVFNAKLPEKTDDISLLFRLFINDLNLFFKLLAYMQLCENLFFKRIILTHLPNNIINDICDRIDNLLIKSDIEPIWSNDTAIILISDNLRYQIICGETKDEIAYVNDRINSYYFNKNSFDIQYNINKILPVAIEKLNSFVFPYEFLIKTNNEIDFKKYISDILENPIEAENIGCKVSHKNSRVGSKIIIENYYEADFLFENSFFVDRFAYFVAKEIINLKYAEKISEDKIALIGYNPYSELLIKKIQFYVNSCNANKISTVIIAKEEDNELVFKFDAVHKKDFEKDCEILSTYKFITIVPIASTLTTNDKIIALFKQKKELQQVKFIYNHCTILVRDEIISEPTSTEKQQKWTNKTSNTITTNFDNAKEINFLIEKKGIWHSLINNAVSFPLNYWKEIPVNQTQNASLNSQNLFSYPNVAIPKNDDGSTKNIEQRQDFYVQTKQKLSEIKEYIYFGHIKNNNNHDRYYINTEEYIRNNNKPLFNEWIKKLKGENVFNEKTSNILITPDINFESDFINIINKELFNDSALVLYIDIEKWRNNLKDKFSFLQAINGNSTKPNFHFIDRVLLTATSYKKAKSYVLSILNETTFNFDSVITLINRLSHDRNKEISESEKTSIYSFTHLFIPPSKDPEKDCTLCELEKNYDKLKDRSVLDGCHAVIKKNKKRIALNPYNRYTNNNEVDQKIELEKITNKNRYFTRMEMKHRLFFEISNIVKEFDGMINTDIEIKRINRRILRKLTELYNECQDTDIEKATDYKISFLKNISSPPLSQYIKMRYYAHRKLLVELHKTIAIREPRYNDLCVLKVILKQLSMLGSNALVRRDVIIGAWELYYKVIMKVAEAKEIAHKAHYKTENRLKKLTKEQNDAGITLFSQGQIINLENEKNKLKQLYENLKEMKEKCEDFNSDFQFFIKNAIFDDEAKSLYLGELLRAGYEIKDEDITKNTIKISKTELENSIYTAFSKINKNYRNYYLRFLLWTFYDNTTIIRKTLENFEKELNKNELLKQYFYVPNSNDNLKKFEEILTNIDIITCSYKNLIKQYYYSSIEKYINQTDAYSKTGNPDGIDFVKELIYVLYAKLKLKKINENIKNNTNDEKFQDIAKALLQVFSEIMGADAAFFSMKYENENTKEITFHTLADNKLDIHINYNEPYYISDILFERGIFAKRKDNRSKIMFPLVIKEILDDFQEKNLLGYNKLACLVLNNPKNQNSEDNVENKIDTIGSITFLYNSTDNFKIKSQEYGRLLLLLKPEFDEYIRHILSEKMIDLWVEKEEIQKLNDDFIVRYEKNSHGAKQCLEDISSHLFDKDLGGNPNIYAIAADLYVGDIHYSLLVDRHREFDTSIYSIADKKQELIPVIRCAIKHLKDKCFNLKNITIQYADFLGKKIYYSEETPFLLFQFIRNIVKHTTNPPQDAKILIYAEDEYIVFKNSNSEITDEKLNDVINKLSNKNTIPRDSISLYCINHYVQNMCSNNRDKKELIVEKENENTFVIKIPIIKL